MTHLFGIQINSKKPLWGALKDIPGLGFSTVEKLLRKLSLSPKSTWTQLTKEQKESIEKYLTDQIKKGFSRELGKDFIRERNIADARYFRLGTNRAIRRRWGYPVRGQNTHSNGRTAKRLQKQR